MTLAPRAAGLASIATLATMTFASTASAATAPSDAGASYLARQLAAGGHQLSTSYEGKSFPATGLTADAILAIDSTGTAAGEAAAATRVFDASVKDYVGYGTDVYAGPTAKALITVLAAGHDPKAATGVDLVANLKGLENAEGRFADKSAYGDNSSTLTQALAIIALTKAGQAVDAKAVSNLLSMQCGTGGFATNPAKQGACAADNDSTSFAVQALAAVGGQKAATGKAVSYLASAQRADGGLQGGVGATSENANSTGLAAVAFAVTGHTANAAKARAFVNSLQYDCSFPEALRGGIAYDKGAFATAKKAGASAKVVDTDTRASAQGMLAFTQKPYVSIVAGGSGATPVVSCASGSSSSATAPATQHPATAPTSAATSAPSSAATSAGATAPSSTSASTAPSALAASSSATTPAVGPVVNTDRETTSVLPIGLAVVAVGALGGGLAFARRR